MYYANFVYRGYNTVLDFSVGAEYGAVTALGINTNSTRLLCGHAKGQVKRDYGSRLTVHTLRDILQHI